MARTSTIAARSPVTEKLAARARVDSRVTQIDHDIRQDDGDRGSEQAAAYDWPVSIERGMKAQFTDTGPTEHRFRDDGTPHQDSEVQGGRRCDECERVAQNMHHEDTPCRQTLRACGPH